MKILILTIATNKYIQFVERLYDNIADNFLKGHDMECLLFTDHDVEASSNVKVSKIEHEDWPMPTLKRYNYFIKEKEQIFVPRKKMSKIVKIKDIVGNFPHRFFHPNSGH